MADLFVPSQVKLDYGGLSLGELHCIRRALYCFKLFCVSFGRSSFDVSQEQRFMNNYRTIAAAEGMQFLVVFETWEIEEIACVRDYAIELYQQLY